MGTDSARGPASAHATATAISAPFGYGFGYGQGRHRDRDHNRGHCHGPGGGPGDGHGLNAPFPVRVTPYSQHGVTVYDPNVSPLFQPPPPDPHRVPDDPHRASEPRFGLGDGPFFNSLFTGTAAHESLADACDAIAATNGTYLDAELADLLSTAEHPPVDADLPHQAAPHSHRKSHRPPFLRDGERGRERGRERSRERGRERSRERGREGNRERGRTWRRLLSVLSVTLTTVLVAAVGILGAAASYPALHGLASGVAPGGVALLWPLLVYGPWLAATLSILRARAYRRRTTHSWCVLILFAAIAMALCIIHAPTTPAGIIVAGLPPVTVLLCFHQLIRQLDLTPGPTPATRHASTSRGAHRQRLSG
ncbi:DUF2637 domain-containing protein [Streptomyces varsoviensis]|uniref:DUF2637 domain-containing protein n=1 Tax=Streptomyces varsoviensis TaxID=67373 RepID=UPI0034088D63